MRFQRSSEENARRRAEITARATRPGTRSPAAPARAVGLAAALLAAALLAACELGRHGMPERQVPGGDPAQGRQLLAEYGCGACHTIPGVDRAEGRVAPPLTAFGDRSFVAGVLPNQPEALIRWIQDPPAVNPLTAMPDLGVTDEHARHMAAYLYTVR